MDDIDEVQGEEARQYVTEEIGDLDQQQPAEHLAVAQRRSGGAKRRCEGAVGCGRTGAANPRTDHQRHRRGRARREHQSPAQPGVKCSRKQQRTDDNADRSGQDPTRHVLLVAVRLRVHQRRLGEGHECARGGVEDHERHQQEAEACRAGHQQQSRREGDAAPGDEAGASSRAAAQRQERLEHPGDQAGNGQEQPDRGVAEAELIANRRPGRLAHSEDHLVEELDREEQRQGSGRPPQQPAPTSGRSARSHVSTVADDRCGVIQPAR
jgi:hypothetical protein